MNLISLSESLTFARQSIAFALIATLGLLSMYVMVEPTMIRSQVYDQFVTSQTITAEISFVGTANNVTMSPSIPGLTGGTANGDTNVRVYTNNSGGYAMTMTASSSPAMQGIGGGTIPDFSTTTTGYMREPAYHFSSTTAGTGAFGFSVYASSTNDVDPSFSHDGAGLCGVGGTTETSGQCWIGASTTPYTIINTTAPTAGSGATTTILLRTVVMSGASIPEDIYYATTTLTATVNP